MSFERYDIHFSGQIMDGQDEAEVKQRIGKLFKVSGAQLQRLFSGKPIAIKRSIDMQTAVKYRELFRNAGALIEITKAAKLETATSTSPGTAPQKRVGSDSDSATTSEAADVAPMTLAPPRSGNLEDCAPTVKPAKIPDISAVQLAPVGSLIPASAELPAPAIDISGLEMFPAQTGSLIDCEQTPEPAPIPDISGLKLSDQEERAV